MSRIDDRGTRLGTVWSTFETHLRAMVADVAQETERWGGATKQNCEHNHMGTSSTSVPESGFPSWPSCHAITSVYWWFQGGPPYALLQILVSEP